MFTKLYLINFALLITHEIDSAYWHEWKLFGIPGGIQVFLLLNLIFILFFLIGAEAVANSKRSAIAFTCLLAFAGVAAFFIHTYFILQGNNEFLLPVSIMILILLLITSSIQLYIVFRNRNAFKKI
ncbi:MAG: hypothetical protein D8M61_08385 [Ignavibacteriae bacterium]|nr:hypothetical protein [Ignavibacteriota bacterium]